MDVAAQKFTYRLLKSRCNSSKIAMDLPEGAVDPENIMSYVDSFLRSRGLLDEEHNLRSDVGDVYREILEETASDRNEDAVKDDVKSSAARGDDCKDDEELSKANNLDANCSTSLMASDLSRSPAKSLKRKGSSSAPRPDASPPQAEKCPRYLPECSICLESLCDKKVGSTQCGHVFCLSCLKGVAETLKKCPLCRKKIAKSKIIELHV